MFASHICCTAQVVRDGTRCIDWCRSIATLVGWGRTCTSFRTPLHGQRRDLAAGGTMLCGRGTTMRLRSTIGAPHPTGRALATSHRCVCLQLCLRSVHRSRITPQSAMTYTCSELLYVIQSGDCALANLLGIDGAGMVCVCLISSSVLWILVDWILVDCRVCTYACTRFTSISHLTGSWLCCSQRLHLHRKCSRDHKAVLLQIAWKNTQQVGCARLPSCYERTPGWARALFVCEYEPQAKRPLFSDPLLRLSA